jgi:large subunit ribosomal protein L29
MALPKIEDARKLNDEELAEEIVAAKRKLFELRLQRATRQLEKTHEFKHMRHKIAQLLTVEGERQRAAVQHQTSSEPEPAAETTATSTAEEE